MSALGRSKRGPEMDPTYADVAAVVPVWDPDLAHLDRTLASIRATLPEGMLICVLDGCAPERELASLIKRHDGTLVLLDERGGPAAATRAGFDLAISVGATWLACLDVGDVWYPEAKRRQIDSCRYYGHLASFAGALDELTGKPWPCSDAWEAALVKDNQFQCSTWVLYGETVRTERIDARLRWGWEWEYALAIQYGGGPGWVRYPEVTGTATQWPGGYSDTKDPSRGTDVTKVARRARDYKAARQSGRPIKRTRAWWR